SCTVVILIFYSYGDHLDLHSFPTRRSSDLHFGGEGRHALRGDAMIAGEDEHFDMVEPGHVAALPAGQPGGDGFQSAEAALKPSRSEEHTSELQSQSKLVCRLLPEKKKRSKY